MTGGDAQLQADIATHGWHVIKVYEDDEGAAPTDAWIRNAQPILADA